MSKAKSKPGDFIEGWIKKTKQDKPDSAIVQAVCDATNNDQLDEAKLLCSLREKAKPIEEQKKP